MLDNLSISPEKQALLEKRRSSLRKSMISDYFCMVLGAGLLLLHFLSVLGNLRRSRLLGPSPVVRAFPPTWWALAFEASVILGGLFVALLGALCLHVGVRSYFEHRRDQALLDEGHLPEDVLPPGRARISWSWLVILILLPFLSLIDSGNSLLPRSAASALLAVVFALIYLMIHAVRKLCWMLTMRARDTGAADDPSR